VQLAVLYAGRARLALVAAEHAVRAANLERSQVTGQQIGAAVGVLMAVKRISHDEARDLLRTTSQYVNRRVSDLAAEVVATGELPPLKRIGPRRGAQPKRPEM
jgi:AmiR/NasT family two-component response regulator